MHSAVQHCVRHRISHQRSEDGSPQRLDSCGTSGTRNSKGNGNAMMHVRDVEVVSVTIDQANFNGGEAMEGAVSMMSGDGDAASKEGQSMEQVPCRWSWCRWCEGLLRAKG